MNILQKRLKLVLLNCFICPPNDCKHILPPIWIGLLIFISLSFTTVLWRKQVVILLFCPMGKIRWITFRWSNRFSFTWHSKIFGKLTFLLHLGSYNSCKISRAKRSRKPSVKYKFYNFSAKYLLIIIFNLVKKIGNWRKISPFLFCFFRWGYNDLSVRDPEQPLRFLQGWWLY